MKKIFLIAAGLLLTCLTIQAQKNKTNYYNNGNPSTPLWQNKGRIAISSDGNEHDNDDWAATPASLAMLAAEGLQNKLVLYTYSDHVWGSNHGFNGKNGKLAAYDQMQKSIIGSKKWFGFDETRFICAVDDPERAYNALRDEINKSSKRNPLIIIGAGPMQVIGEAISRAKKSKRQYVTVISHSWWNNQHADHPASWEKHTGWTWDKMKSSFGVKNGGNTHFVQILDQNHGKDYEGLFTDRNNYNWVKTSTARNNPKYKDGAWDFLYERLSSVIKTNKKTHIKCFDPSDAGMIIFMLTGIQKTNPEMMKQIMENPK